MSNSHSHESQAHENTDGRWCVSRRSFLLAAAGAAAAVTLGSVFAKPALAQEQPVEVKEYPRKKVGTVNALKTDQPVEIRYPFDDDYSRCLLVKLGRPAGGGVGPSNDIVAFSTLCTHTGGPMVKSYNGQYKALGPCPMHLTTFDLTRHGIVVAGQATESLPQVILTVEGDDIYAVAMVGLMFGTANNLIQYPAKKS